MRKGLIIITALVLVTTSLLTGCAGGSDDEEATEGQTASVERGDLLLTVRADGNLDMPHQVKLRFGTPGTVKQIFVDEGDEIREGALLAKLDDTAHKIAISTALYDVELAMNDIAGKIHPSLMGYPNYYPDTTTYLRLEQAQEELEQVPGLVEQSSYEEAVAKLRIAQHDLEASYYMLNIPEIAKASTRYDEYGTKIEMYPDIPKAINLLEQDQERLANVQTLIEHGNYEEALAKLDISQRKLAETGRLVKNVSGRISVTQRAFACCTRGTNPGAGAGSLLLSYPDTSTSLNCLRQVEEELQDIQNLMEQEDYNRLELAELVRMAQHDADMSHTILEDNELIFRNGAPLQDLRGYNLKLQKAEEALKNAKEDLMKTEILAPFDGTVVDIGVKENDQLSSFDYSSITAIHLVDTNTVELDGVVDEIDIFKVKIGQEVVITLDALPDVDLKGKVTFISPFGTTESGIIEFAVTIALDPTELELRGSLTATADIIIERHDDVLLIPGRAVKGSPENWWVEVIIDESTGETEERQIVLGAEDGKFSEVVSGLKEGEKIIVSTATGK